MTFTLATDHGPLRVRVRRRVSLDLGLPIFRIEVRDPAQANAVLVGHFVGLARGTPGRATHFRYQLRKKVDVIARVLAGERHLIVPVAPAGA